MRATASVGVLSEGPDGMFSEIPMSAVLRKNANPSLACGASRSWVEGNGTGAPGRTRNIACGPASKQALDHIYGAHIFEYFKQHPEEAQIFDEAMTGISTIDSPQWLALTRLTESVLSWMSAVGTDSYWQPSWHGTRKCEAPCTMRRTSRAPGTARSNPWRNAAHLPRLKCFLRCRRMPMPTS
jgi:hypothetical protein